MKRKWFIICVACFLLFSACTNNEVWVDGSDTHTPSDPLIKTFETFDAYEKTFACVSNIEELYTALGATERQKAGLEAQNVAMMLQGGFILLPQISRAITRRATFYNEGYSVFEIQLPHTCVITVKIYHDKRIKIPRDYWGYERISAEGEKVAQYRKEERTGADIVAEEKFTISTHGYFAEVTSPNGCDCVQRNVYALEFKAVPLPIEKGNGSSPPAIKLNTDITIRADRGRWCFVRNGEIARIHQDAPSPRTEFFEDVPYLEIAKENNLMTVYCALPPEDIRVSAGSMTDTDKPYVTIGTSPVTTLYGETAYTFQLLEDDVYAYDIVLYWNRFNTTNSARYSFYAKVQE